MGDSLSKTSMNGCRGICPTNRNRLGLIPNNPPERAGRKRALGKPGIGHNAPEKEALPTDEGELCLLHTPEENGFTEYLPHYRD